VTNKTLTLGATYKFDLLKLHGYFIDNKIDGSTGMNGYQLGVTVPVGSGEMAFAVQRRNMSDAANSDAQLVALRYTHFLSKRTSAYVSGGRQTNRGNAASGRDEWTSQRPARWRGRTLLPCRLASSTCSKRLYSLAGTSRKVESGTHDCVPDPAGNAQCSFDRVKKFDYIIVGAGSAGCVLANRLTQDPGCNVLLIEAGKRPTGLLRDMPAALFKMMAGRPDLNWNFVSEPEAGLCGRTLPVPRGKTLGGSSQINGLVYARGHWRDYEDWAQSGASGWDYRGVLPYFRRMESSWAGSNEFRGAEGPLGVSSPTDAALMYDIYRDAASQAGYPVTDDYHGRQAEGFTRIELTTRRGRRSSTLLAYLADAMKRPNLTVVSDAQTTQMLIERGRANGVEYVQNGRPQKVHCEREVLLSAGAYGSPQILMLSGIGPADELRENGITPLVDLPGVGKNLMEHPLVWIHFQARSKTMVEQLRFDRAALNALRWGLKGDGLFATNCCAGHLFAQSEPGLDRADLQLSCFALDKNAKPWFPLLKPRAPDGLGLMIQTIRNDSRGRVALASSDPLAAPRISLNVMAVPSDVDRMLRGIAIGRNLFAQPALSKFGVTEDAPGPACQDRDALEKYIRNVCATSAHPVGTCKMGQDSMAVVDEQLRVRGVQGLRVIDASIMPTIPGGNTNAAAIMIGERGADLVRGQVLPPSDLPSLEGVFAESSM